jgi:Uncharacterized protein conserved in bacteria (DUF2272)
MRVIALIACAGLIATGCATRPIGAPPLTPSAAIQPNFLVPNVRERMIFLARQEWTLFGQPVVIRDGNGVVQVEFEGAATHEIQPAMLSRVLMYWYAVTRLPIVGNQGELEPWSAAFISWLAKSAGLTPEDFPPTVLHWDYIERALKARDGARFAAHDPRAYAPKVGDLVCISRSNAVAGFAELRRGPYHCDLVVGVEAGEINAIGGNVSDAVSLARYEVDERGLLKHRDDQPWVVVIEQRDAHRGPSDPRRLSDARSCLGETPSRFQIGSLGNCCDLAPTRVIAEGGLEPFDRRISDPPVSEC